MFQTFVFVWCNVFCCSLPSFGLSNTCSAPTHYQKPFSKVHLPPTSAPNAPAVFRFLPSPDHSHMQEHKELVDASTR